MTRRKQKTLILSIFFITSFNIWGAPQGELMEPVENSQSTVQGPNGPQDISQESNEPDPSFSPPGGQDYYQAITATSAMVWDQRAQDLAAQYGMQVMNVTWEDTGRYKNSAVGPNISDMTIQVGYENPENKTLK
jgi:hypothetical protein